MRRIVIPIVGITMAIIGSACGTSSSGSSSTTTSSSTTSSSSDGGTVASDTALAQQINLQTGDFPAGWQSQPSSSSGSGTTSTRQLLACIGASTSLAAITVNVDSPNFSQSQPPGELDAGSNVDFAPTAAQATGAFRAFSSPKANSCVQRVLAAELQRQKVSAPGGLAVSSLPVTVPSGDQALAFAATTSVVTQGQTVPVEFQIVLIARGRAEISMLTGGIATTFPPSLQQSLLAAMTNRATQVPA
jgi:hypothetical protein